MEKWKKAMASVLKKMDRQKWIVCILLGVLLLVIIIPVDTKEKEAFRGRAKARNHSWKMRLM